jgi:hypothetical protein
MSDFWSAFWPNLASTILGVIIGLPAALWINRRVTQEADVQRQASERGAVAHALEILRLALGANKERLERYAKALAESSTLYDTGLDSSSWDALQSELTAELGDPDLRQRLAYHFSRTEAVKKLNDMYLNFSVGVESSMSNAAEVRRALGTALPRAVAELLQESQELMSSIDAARERLTGAARPQLTA